jgi:hypothetical protein
MNYGSYVQKNAAARTSEESEESEPSSGRKIPVERKLEVCVKAEKNEFVRLASFSVT